MSMKNPLTPAGIEPVTFGFVAQHLNHCATAVPPPSAKSKERLGLFPIPTLRLYDLSQGELHVLLYIQ